MTTAKKEKAASPCQGEAAQQTSTKPKRTTKLDHVEAMLKRPSGLNRFEASRVCADTCLNSTVAVLSKRYGNCLVSEWETVPCRFSERGVRVKRYWIVEGQGNDPR